MEIAPKFVLFSFLDPLFYGLKSLIFLLSCNWFGVCWGWEFASLEIRLQGLRHRTRLRILRWLFRSRCPSLVWIICGSVRRLLGRESHLLITLVVIETLVVYRIHTNRLMRVKNCIHDFEGLLLLILCLKWVDGVKHVVEFTRVHIIRIVILFHLLNHFVNTRFFQIVLPEFKNSFVPLLQGLIS